MSVEEPSAERGQHVVVPEAHAFPAPVARNSSWPPSHGCGPSSALVHRGSVKICEQNLHNRLWLLLGNLRRLGRSLLCSFASCAAHWSHHT
jgi:hypothetical protein